MKTITLEIKNDIALKFLHNLESLNIIRFIETKSISNKLKLSEKFSGSISKEKADKLQDELIKMREEWEKNI